MGQVYQATDTKLNRQVALKILPEAFASDPDRLARFPNHATRRRSTSLKKPKTPVRSWWSMLVTTTALYPHSRRSTLIQKPFLEEPP